MVVNDGLGNQEGRAGVRRGDSHIQQVGLGNDRCGNIRLEGAAHGLLNVFAHHGAVDQLGKHRCQIRGGGEIAVNRGGTGPGGDHEGGLGLIFGRVLHIRQNIGANTHRQGDEDDCQPVLQHIPQHHNGVEGQQGIAGNRPVIAVFHVHSSTTTIRRE